MSEMDLKNLYTLVEGFGADALVLRKTVNAIGTLWVGDPERLVYLDDLADATELEKEKNIRDQADAAELRCEICLADFMRRRD